MRISSRSIDDLTPDVAANCRVLIRLCKAIGIPIGFSCTLRNQEEQTYLHETIGAPKYIAFHGFGLAFDIYIDIPGLNYDETLIRKVAVIAKKIGFSWMYDIAGYDSCHFQWDEHREITTTEVRQHIFPRTMPLYEEIDLMSQFIENMATKYNKSTAEVETALETILQIALHKPADWEIKGEQNLFNLGLTTSTHKPNEIVTFATLGAIEGHRK